MVEKYLLSFTVWNVFKSSFDASCVELQFLTPEMSLIAFMSLITNAHAIDIGHSNQWSSTLSLRYSIYSICIRDGYEQTKNQPKRARNEPHHKCIYNWHWCIPTNDHLHSVSGTPYILSAVWVEPRRAIKSQKELKMSQNEPHLLSALEVAMSREKMRRAKMSQVKMKAVETAARDFMVFEKLRQVFKMIELLNNKSHGLLPPGGFSSLFFDQMVPYYSQRHLADQNPIDILHH